MKQYSELYDIVEQTFYSWVKKYRKSEEGEKGFATIEIMLTKERRSLLFAEVNRISFTRKYLQNILKPCYYE